MRKNVRFLRIFAGLLAFILILSSALVSCDGGSSERDDSKNRQTAAGGNSAEDKKADSSKSKNTGEKARCFNVRRRSSQRSYDGYSRRA